MILSLSTFAYAEFAILRISELVTKNNLIIIGHLRDVSETETDELRISKGTLTIEKIVDGKFTKPNGQSLKIGDEVSVEWINSKLIACQFGFSENNKGIWFLNVGEKGDVEPLTPSTLASTGDLAEVEKYLRKKKKDSVVKILNTTGDGEQVSSLNSAEKEPADAVRCLYSIKPKQKQYFPFAASLAFLASVALYYLLYRSRFKIR
jgi:hypothetical protein